MSRATVSKSRADKIKEKDKDRGGSTTVPAPPVNTDVIPGRFTETDWGTLLDKEEGEDYSVEIVGDIVSSALHIIYENYIQKQLYPYTVTQARDAILQIVEWQFLARDEGEEKPEDNFTWQEEDEPQPAVPDAWAQGSVPTQPQPALSATASEPDTDVTSVSHISEPEVLDDLPTSVNETGTIIEADETYSPVKRPDIDQEEKMKEKSENEIQEASKKPTEAKPRKFKYKPHRGPLRSAGLRSITKPLEETDKELALAEQGVPDPLLETKRGLLEHMPSSCHSILRVQAGRPPGSKDITYDEKGNVVSVVKLDPERLPSHRVKTKYTVVNPTVEAAHARLVAMRTGRYISGADKMLKTVNGLRGKGLTEQTESTRNGQTSKAGGRIATSATFGMSNTIPLAVRSAYESNTVGGGITPLPPPLIESMELSPGVVVKEGNRVKRGPKLQLRHGEAVTSAKLHSLHAIGVRDNNNGSSDTRQELTIAQILSSRSPVLRPLHATEPVPPIVPRPSHSAQESAV